MTHNDDEPIGTILNRREALAFLGVVSAAMLASCAPGQSPATEQAAATSTPAGATDLPASTPTTGSASTAVSEATSASTTMPTCVVRPAMTEGPYFVDELLNRSDVRSDPSDNSVREGVPLKLIFHVSQLNSAACMPLSGAVVDIWHCDAQGLYSDVEQQAGKKFLRGYQVSDSTGLAEFTTIYPGWYQGRATHIHFKIRSDANASATWDFTSQLFFDEATNDAVYATSTYARGGNRLLNAQDGIYQNGGDQLLLAPSQDADGYTATFDIGLQLS